ncbi:MAG: hypothetical protein KDD40_11850 [Bdellovibrionales bacterium]|nr:hypothetical protein [Bdellovibrionales bacterium]
MTLFCTKIALELPMIYILKPLFVTIFLFFNSAFAETVTANYCDRLLKGANGHNEQKSDSKFIQATNIAQSQTKRVYKVRYENGIWYTVYVHLKTITTAEHITTSLSFDKQRGLPSYWNTSLINLLAAFPERTQKILKNHNN